MKRTIFSSIVIVFVFLFGLAVTAYACPWYDPFCSPTPTNTPTPTPKPFIQQIVPTIKFKPGIFVTNTPTSTPTNTPTATVTPTLTITPSATSTVAQTATETPVMATVTETPEVTPTPEAKTASVAGLTLKEIGFAGLVVVLLIIILIQGNWASIKKWMHDKTA